jgi:hypothetical protein
VWGVQGRENGDAPWLNQRHPGAAVYELVELSRLLRHRPPGCRGGNAVSETRAKCAMCGRPEARLIDHRGRGLMDDKQEAGLCFSDGVCLAMSERQRRMAHSRLKDAGAEIRYQAEKPGPSEDEEETS